MFLSMIFVIAQFSQLPTSQIMSFNAKMRDTVVAKCPATISEQEAWGPISISSDVPAQRAQAKRLYSVVARCIPKSTGLDRAYLYANALLWLNAVMKRDPDAIEGQAIREKIRSILKLAIPLAKSDDVLTAYLNDIADAYPL